jgi:hypothetical protein
VVLALTGQLKAVLSIPLPFAEIKVACTYHYVTLAVKSIAFLAGSSEKAG